MTDKELNYYYPYSIDKQHNFRGMREDSRIKMKFEPEYENVFENGNYVSRIKNFEEKQLQITKNAYVLENFGYWNQWFENGRNIFSFSKELLEMLNHTDVSELNYKSFNLPYDNFYISLKPLEIKIAENTDIIIEGVYVSIDRMAMDKSFNEEDPLVFDYAISFDFVGDFLEQKLIDYDKIYDGYGDGIGGANFWQYSFYFMEKDGVTTIKDGINDTKEMFKSSYFPEDKVDDIHLDAYNRHINFIDKTCTILVNSLLYLSLPKENKEIVSKYPKDLPHNFNKKLKFAKTKKDKTKINDRIKETGFSKIQFVGGSFSEYKNKESNNNIGLSPHWRRGHWRNQVHGKGLKEKRLIWIKPTIVNKDLGQPEKGHLYEVKDNVNSSTE